MCRYKKKKLQEEKDYTGYYKQVTNDTNGLYCFYLNSQYRHLDGTIYYEVTAFIKGAPTRYFMDIDEIEKQLKSGDIVPSTEEEFSNVCNEMLEKKIQEINDSFESIKPGDIFYDTNRYSKHKLFKIEEAYTLVDDGTISGNKIIDYLSVKYQGDYVDNLYFVNSPFNRIIYRTKNYEDKEWSEDVINEDYVHFFVKGMKPGNGVDKTTKNE